MRQKVRISVIFMASLLAISTAVAQSSTAPDACGLLDRQAAETAFGAAVPAGRSGVATEAITTCSFPIGAGKISILIRRSVGQTWIAEQEERMSRGTRFHPVAGLGKQAFTFDLADAGVALCVFGPDYFLQVSVFHAGPALTVLPATEKLARAAISRVEGTAVPNARSLAEARR
jgi:hypothetical protein